MLNSKFKSIWISRKFHCFDWYCKSHINHNLFADKINFGNHALIDTVYKNRSFFYCVSSNIEFHWNSSNLSRWLFFICRTANDIWISRIMRIIFFDYLLFQCKRDSISVYFFLRKNVKYALYCIRITNESIEILIIT